MATMTTRPADRVRHRRRERGRLSKAMPSLSRTSRHRARRSRPASISGCWPSGAAPTLEDELDDFRAVEGRHGAGDGRTPVLAHHAVSVVSQRCHERGDVGGQIVGGLLFELGCQRLREVSATCGHRLARSSRVGHVGPIRAGFCPSALLARAIPAVRNRAGAGSPEDEARRCAGRAGCAARPALLRAAWSRLRVSRVVRSVQP
jgi:hypothetical protein